MRRGDRSLVRAGQFAQLARQGGLITVALALPRLGVGTAAIGDWEGLLYAGYVLGFGWLTGLTQAYLTVVRRRRDPAALGRWLLNRVLLVSAALLLVAALGHGALFGLLQFPGPPRGWAYFFVYLLVQWAGLTYEQRLAAEQRPRELFAFAALSGLGFVLSLLVPLYLGRGLVTALGCLAAFSALRLTYVLLRNRPAPTPQQPPLPKREPTGDLLATALPLMAFASLNAANAAFDPWFVNYWFDGDPATFARFRYGTRELPLVVAGINGLSLVALARLGEDRAAGLALLRAGSRRLMHWVFPVVLLLLLTSPYWWEPLFTARFADSLPLFQLYVFVVASRLLLPTTVLTGLGHAAALPWFAVLEVVTNVVLSVLLASAYGLAGVVLATVLAYLLDKLAIAAYLRWRTGIPPSSYLAVRWYLAYLAVLTAAWWLISH